MIEIERFFNEQLAVWPMAAANFEALARTKVRDINGVTALKVQCNPARIRSTGAKVDAASVSERPCFLCAANRPAEQLGLPWHDYTVLVNPYPIFPRHFTIPANDHTPQLIKGRVADMMQLAHDMPGYTVFYNGAYCGASAPDHMHFQAVETNRLPVWQLVADSGCQQHLVGGMLAYVVHYSDIAIGAREVEALLDGLDAKGAPEPMINLLCRDGVMIVIPRKAHRPDNYGTSDDQILLSPASIDLAGVLIAPLEKDFNGLDAEKALRVIDQVCYV